MPNVSLRDHYATELTFTDAICAAAGTFGSRNGDFSGRTDQPPPIRLHNAHYTHIWHPSGRDRGILVRRACRVRGSAPMDDALELDRRAGKAEKDDHPLAEPIPADTSDASNDRVAQPGEDLPSEDALPERGRS
jgi:hypothetical protein